MKGEILDYRLLALVKLILPQFAMNTSLRRTDQTEFEMHATSLSSVQPPDFDATSHQVSAMEDEGS